MNVPRASMRPTTLAAAAAAALAACSLEETGANFISPNVFYQNDAQAASAVNGVYAPLMDWNGWKQPAQHSIMCDDDEMLCWNWMGGGFSGQSAGQWCMQDNAVWFGDYRIIERANDVIENVARSGGISEGMKKTATGQALFARGYAYFDLVRRYGGVPLRTEAYVPDAQMGAKARSSVAEVYQQVAKDLREAAGLLPASYATPNGQGLPRAAAAWGLLAKVYLHIAGDEGTGTPLAANKAAYLDSATLAAQAVMVSGTASLEASYMGLVARNIAFKFGNWSEGCGSFDQQYDSITIKDAVDPTQTSTAIYAVGRPVYSLKYIDPQHLGSDQAPANNFIILRYADVLLLFAEAENERNVGPTTAAYDAINQVRARAGLAALSGLTKDEFRQAVWTERAHELYGEFQARFDLIREGRWLSVMNQPSTIPAYAGQGICRPRQAYQKLQPIPQRELAANPLLQQNPGY